MPHFDETLHKILHILPQQQATHKKVAWIIEEECIGCTKCIPTCPTDAIVGTGKRLHTILESDCTGCEECIAHCPVDCIQMVSAEDPIYHKLRYKTLYEQKQARSSQIKKTETQLPTDKKNYIAKALEQYKLKKNERKKTSGNF